MIKTTITVKGVPAEKVNDICKGLDEGRIPYTLHIGQKITKYDISVSTRYQTECLLIVADRISKELTDRKE